LITFSDISLLVGLYNEKLELLRQMEDTYEKLNSTKLQLIHKEKLATIGHISAGVAHEIKNPLSFVTSNHRFVRKKMEQLEASGQCDEFRDDMNEIKEVMKDSDEGLERILAVINNLLVFSRKESDEKMDFGFDINAGLERTILILKGTIDPSLEIDKNYGNIDKIECYGGEINQVFLNLLTNAAQAVEPIHGTPGKIVIRTWEENTQVFCSIGNTGKPIESDIMEKIFDPFFTTKESGKGTGLGLSIVSDIVVKRHNGTIDVGHEKDMTVFTVALPKKRNAFTVIA
jgi:two-component system, NtrC family, sensor kinase